MCRRTLLGHKDDVTSLSAVGLRRRAGGAEGASPRGAGSPRGGGGGGGVLAALVASASADGTVRVWCAPTWACLRVLVPSPPMAPGSPSGGASYPPPQPQPHPPVLTPAVATALRPPPHPPAPGGGHVPPPPPPPAAAVAAAAAAAAAAALRPPAPVRIGHSSFASFDFSGDDFSFGGSHASERGAAAAAAAAAAHAHAPARQHVGFVVGGGGGVGSAHGGGGGGARHGGHAGGPPPPARPPPPAALCVAIGRGLVAAGAADGGVRLWHLDELCGAATEALDASGRSPTVAGAGLEPALSAAAGGDLRSFASVPGGGFLGASPPPSPRGGGGGGAPPALLLGGGGAAAAAAPPAAPQQLAGRACARLRAGCGGDAAAPAAAAPAAAAAAACGACGSMDQQLVRSLRELVAIRTVSSSQVRGRR